jgi:hypothetical protein
VRSYALRGGASAQWQELKIRCASLDSEIKRSESSGKGLTQGVVENISKFLIHYGEDLGCRLIVGVAITSGHDSEIKKLGQVWREDGVECIGILNMLCSKQKRKLHTRCSGHGFPTITTPGLDLDALVDLLFGNWSLGEAFYFTGGSGVLRTKHLSLVRNPKAYDGAASNGSSCVNVFILVYIGNLVSRFLLLLL